MKKFWFIFFLLNTFSLFAQWSTPAGYTNFLKLRYYSLDAQPGADSIRANLEDIDNFASMINDTVLALLSRANNIIDYNGAIKNSVIAYDNFNPVLKAKLVTKDLTETITGSKTFTSTTYLRNTYPTLDLTYNLGNSASRWRRGYFGWLYADYLILTDPNNISDTAIVFYDDGKITYNNLVQFAGGTEFSGSITADSIKFDGSVTYSHYWLTVNKSDSISLVIANTSLVYLEPTDNVPTVKYIDYFRSTSSGALVRLVNTSIGYTITLKDESGVSGGNLFLSGDFVMGRNDVITLIWVYQGFNSWAWVEVSRSDN